MTELSNSVSLFHVCLLFSDIVAHIQ